MNICLALGHKTAWADAWVAYAVPPIILAPWGETDTLLEHANHMASRHKLSEKGKSRIHANIEWLKPE